MFESDLEFPAGTEVQMTDPLFDGAPPWFRDGAVGLAKVDALRDEGGRLTVTINFVPALVTRREAAAFLRISRRTVGRLVERGELTTRKLGPEHRITWDSLVRCAGLACAGPAETSD